VKPRTLASDFERLDDALGELLDHYRRESIEAVVSILCLFAFAITGAFLLAEWFTS